MARVDHKMLGSIAGRSGQFVSVVAGFALASILSFANPANAASLGGNLAHAKPIFSGSAGLVQLAHKRRYRHCHGGRRCHGRGEYYHYTPTPYVYVPRYYAPYRYRYGGGWGYYGGYGHHFGGHQGGHH